MQTKLMKRRQKQMLKNAEQNIRKKLKFAQNAPNLLSAPAT